MTRPRRVTGASLLRAAALGAVLLAIAGPAQAQESTLAFTPVCDRSASIIEEIVRLLKLVSALEESSTCADVTATHVDTWIRSLNMDARGLSELRPADFSGMTKLQYLRLRDNGITAVPDGFFAHLPGLSILTLGGNGLASLPAAVFAGLPGLTILELDHTGLSSLPAGIFAGLTALQTLTLNHNGLGSLPAGVFAGLTALQELDLGNNRLTAVRADLLQGRANLVTLRLNGNRLAELPDGLFHGLRSLRALRLEGNAVDPLPLRVSLSLQGSGTGRVRATIDTGAPFHIVLPVSVASGAIDGQASAAITIRTGRSSAVFTVDREPSTRAVTVAIGALPELPRAADPAAPAPHAGYVLRRVLPAAVAGIPAGRELRPYAAGTRRDRGGGGGRFLQSGYGG